MQKIVFASGLDCFRFFRLKLVWLLLKETLDMLFFGFIYIYILVCRACRQKNLFHSFNFLVFTAIQVMVFPLQKNISRTFGIGRGRLYSIIVA